MLRKCKHTKRELFEYSSRRRAAGRHCLWFGSAKSTSLLFRLRKHVCLYWRRKVIILRLLTNCKGIISTIPSRLSWRTTEHILDCGSNGEDSILSVDQRKLRSLPKNFRTRLLLGHLWLDSKSGSISTLLFSSVMSQWSNVSLLLGDRLGNECLTLN